MIIGFLFIAVQIILGIVLVCFFDPERKFHPTEKLIGGTIIGLIISNFLILIFVLLFQSLQLGIIAFLLIAFFVLGLNLRKILEFFNNLFFYIKNKKWLALSNLPLVFLLIILIFYAFYLSTVLSYDEAGRIKATLPGWGDSAFHLLMIERLATANPFTLEHPIFAGTKLTYPFIINFISAVFREIGSDTLSAYRLPLFTFGIAGLFLIFAFAYRILKSKGFAVIALLLILWGSGLGFFTLFKDANIAYQQGGLDGFIALLKNPPHEYTHLDNRTGGKSSQKETNDNIVWIVPLVSFLTHQRSFTAGFAIFSLILLGIYYYGNTPHFWRFGVLAGLLPLSHSHSFLALFFLMAVLIWFFLKNWKAWLGFGVITLLLAFPQITYYYLNSDIASKGFFKPWFGWMTCNHSTSWLFCDISPDTDSNVFIFWLKNFGMVFWIWVLVLWLLALLYFLIPKENEIWKKFKIHFVIASLFLFLIPNLFLFQPWEFDNNKIFFYWWILAIIFCVIPLFQIFSQKNILGKGLIVFLIFFAILAGTFDFTSKLLQAKKEVYGYSDGTDYNIEIGNWIKANTAENNLFLTASVVDPVPIFLAGRPVYLGYEGWLWSAGLDYKKNRNKAEEILAGNLHLACEEKINYIFLDNALKNSFPNLNEKNILENTETVFIQESPYGKVEILKVICSQI